MKCLNSKLSDFSKKCLMQRVIVQIFVQRGRHFKTRIHSFVHFLEHIHFGSSCYVSITWQRTETITTYPVVFDLGQFPTTFLVTDKPFPSTSGLAKHSAPPLASLKAFPLQEFSYGTNRKDGCSGNLVPSWPNYPSCGGKMSAVGVEDTTHRAKQKQAERKRGGKRRREEGGEREWKEGKKGTTWHCLLPPSGHTKYQHHPTCF